MHLINSLQNPIIALATPYGRSALAVVRLSGEQVIEITLSVFSNKKLAKSLSHTLHVGVISDEEGIIDEVVIGLFRAPKTFTKENLIEISCHGSPLIVQRILTCFINRGVRLANPGEFTQRAFLNGRLDLTQAEAVADLIAADSRVGHKTALHQMRGGFSSRLKDLREQLQQLGVLLTLELDFSEEDVIFAGRMTLQNLLQKALEQIDPLIKQFALRNVLKEGIPTVIAGGPNVGKSTLLNTLLNTERAIVTDLPGTTRDPIEDTLNLGKSIFRIIDTAGLRMHTDDKIEAIGIAKTKEKLKSAGIIIYVFDLTQTFYKQIVDTINDLNHKYHPTPIIYVGNKIDQTPPSLVDKLITIKNIHLISALQNTGLDQLKETLIANSELEDLAHDTVVVNARHYACLCNSQKSLQNIVQGLHDNMPSEILAQDLQHALYHLGEITGVISTDDLLDCIFSQFCIGK